MNTNQFYRELFEQNLGLDSLGLEDRCSELVKIVDSTTLLAFGNLIPIKYLHYLDLTDTSKIVKKEQHTLGVEYYIDDPVLDKFHLPILGIEKIEYNNVGDVDPYDPDSTAYYNSVITSRQNLTLESVLFGNEYSYQRVLSDSAMPFKRYHELRGQRVLYLKNYAIQGTVEVTLKTRWPNVVSIPEEYHEDFLRLATLDCKIKLWNDLKYLSNIVTSEGNLELNFDWSNTEQERTDFLRELRTRSFPDRTGPMYFQIL